MEDLPFSPRLRREFVKHSMKGPCPGDTHWHKGQQHGWMGSCQGIFNKVYVDSAKVSYLADYYLL